VIGLASRWGQSVVIENRPGGDGLVAITSFTGGVLGPRNLPAEARERISADVRELLSDQTISARLTATGQVVNPGTAAEFGAAIEAQRKQAAEVGKLLGLKPAQ